MKKTLKISLAIFVLALLGTIFFLKFQNRGIQENTDIGLFQAMSISQTLNSNNIAYSGLVLEKEDDSHSIYLVHKNSEFVCILILDKDTKELLAIVEENNLIFGLIDNKTILLLPESWQEYFLNNILGED